jgi:hypothetical protein
MEHQHTTTLLINRFAPVIAEPCATTGLDERLLLERQGNLAVYYAPFEYLNPSARVALVGITPGPTQMANAISRARVAIQAGSSPADAVRLAKETAGFSGEPLRTNLVNQLNDWGVHKWLGLSSAAELFGPARHLVHTTSLLRFPVFRDGKKYEGTPDMTRHPMLRRLLLEHFVREIEQLPQAVFITLGPKVAGVIEALVADGVLSADRVVTGMLHPSGENGYRIKYLLGDRSGAVPHRTSPRAYDEGRAAFHQRYLGRQLHQPIPLNAAAEFSARQDANQRDRIGRGIRDHGSGTSRVRKAPATDTPAQINYAHPEANVTRRTSEMSGAFSFILHSGVEVFPVKMRSRATGRIAFRVSPGGTGGNTLAATEQVDEATMVKRVLGDGFGVRCSSLDGAVQGQYKAGHRAVKEVRRRT